MCNAITYFSCYFFLYFGGLKTFFVSKLEWLKVIVDFFNKKLSMNKGLLGNKGFFLVEHSANIGILNQKILLNGIDSKLDDENKDAEKDIYNPNIYNKISNAGMRRQLLEVQNINRENY